MSESVRRVYVSIIYTYKYYTYLYINVYLSEFSIVARNADDDHVRAEFVLYKGWERG